MVVSATMPTLVAASVVVRQAAATLVAPAMAVVLTTAHLVATSATNNPVLSNAANPASISARTVADLMRPAATSGVVTALSNALHPPIHGTVVTAVAHHVKTHAKMAHVKVVAAGKIVAVTTAMQPDPHRAVPPVTSLRAAPSSLAPATSNPTLQRAKALQASAAAHAF